MIEIKQDQTRFWRDERLINTVAQVVFIFILVALVFWIFSNYRQRGLIFSFRFLAEEASFDISEGIEFHPTDPYYRAFLVGVINTVRVAVLGIVFSTILGTFTGISRLSGNWLLRKLATIYVELIRNTPLLVQLFFLYFAIFMRLPRIQHAIILPGSGFLSNRGLTLPGLVTGSNFSAWLFWVAMAIIGTGFLVFLRGRTIKTTGRPAFNFGFLLLPLILIPILGSFAAGGSVLNWDLPSIHRSGSGILKLEGGINFSSEFLALLTGLVIYTSAYIAEVVRAGVQAVPKGQTEAARSQGFTQGQILGLIVMPQALRIIIPPLISQYLNLTKNSSLAIAIGFLDLYAVSQTMLNQSGRVVEVFLMIMASYLSLSLTISYLMNLFNKHFQIVER
ncbi:MAG: ABC transporter permease subunit [Candidatus Thiodiazotropha sp.]